MNKQIEIKIDMPSKIPKELIEYLFYINMDYILYGKEKIKLLSMEECQEFVNLIKR